MLRRLVRNETSCNIISWDEMACVSTEVGERQIFEESKGPNPGTIENFIIDQGTVEESQEFQIQLGLSKVSHRIPYSLDVALVEMTSKIMDKPVEELMDSSEVGMIGNMPNRGIKLGGVEKRHNTC